ncbi:hypothetical protein O181_044642 [Austropuccinia psidii MF-1]|uniref:UBC core domain-containing protein n=1 Tax=Austropuccinia psidii MF-1 TaxID=1389203 RepID=A0A9Q3HHZ1_9BASI|nr:hypothetical protein [Austropuccinia psidii MF-1]
MESKELVHLMDMGATRAAAISALKASKGDLNEAANVVFEPKHMNARDQDISFDLSASFNQSSTSATKSTLQESYDCNTIDNEEQLTNSSDSEIFQDLDFFVDEDERETTGADPFAQISFQRDRKVTVVEVEEPAQQVKLRINDALELAHLMPQSEWMKGCAEGNEQSFLFQVYSRLTEAHCRCPTENCSGMIQRNKTDFFAIPSTFSLYLQHLQETAKRQCTSCNRVVCLACSCEITSDQLENLTSVESTSDVLSHCPDLQAVILGVGLFLVQKMYHDFDRPIQLKPITSTTRPLKRIKSASTSAFDSENFPNSAGIGYGGVVSGRDDQSGQEAASREQIRRDKALAALLSSVRSFLPNRDRPGGTFRASDHMPSIATAIHIRRRFNPIASELLKNGSLFDMSERKVLYEEFLDWLMIISLHENLCPIMGQPIMRVSSSADIVPHHNSTNASQEAIREKEIVYEGSAGPRELLENILRQVKAAKRTMKYTTFTKNNFKYSLSTRCPEEANQDMEKLESFCDQFQKAVDLIDKSLRQNNNAYVIDSLKNSSKMNMIASEDLTDVSLEILKTSYVKWAESVRYEYYDFQLPTPVSETSDDLLNGDHSDGLGPAYKHTFSKDIQLTFSHPARNLIIAREHSTLCGSLPVAWDSSVFLRVDESRPDVMKVLITGPEGTPYLNGCFIFDVFLDSQYNHRPPRVMSMTTKNGLYRLNPNLYADGKVCLSLLGTWIGPGWISGKSTLLQVIVSIQSMILCDEPYLNEPGWSKCSGTPESKAYTLNVRRMVADDAILGSLKNPDPAFKPVIETHFKLKAKVIKDQLDQWLKEDDGQSLQIDNLGGVGAIGAAKVGSGDDQLLRKNVEEIKQRLDKLLIEDND